MWKKTNELVDFTLVSVAMLAIGIYGLAVKRNFIRMLFAVEIIINAANLNLVAIAAAEVAVGLSLIIVAYRMYQNVDIADFRSLKG